jgi:hypothetical protein
MSETTKVTVATDGGRVGDDETPAVTEVGNPSVHQTGTPTATKILFRNEVFTAPLDQQLKDSTGMPITRAGNAPYLHSFNNLNMNQDQVREALNEYDYTAGGVGSSTCSGSRRVGVRVAAEAGERPVHPPLRPRRPS